MSEQLPEAVAARRMFRRFPRWTGNVESGWTVNFLGIRTRESFYSSKPTETPYYHSSDYPALDELYPEWVNLIEAAMEANRRFTMMELGAGWGRWLGNAVGVARELDLDYRLIGVEPEPTHFRWLKQHLKDNDVPDKATILYEAAVARTPGFVPFHVGDPQSWYGQAIARANERPRARRGFLRGLTSSTKRSIVPIKALRLDEILDDLDYVDLVDVDVQGVEADVLEPVADVLDAKVRRIYIRTHDADGEDRLHDLFTDLSWYQLWEFPHQQTSATPWGEITFGDGVSAWFNGKADPGHQVFEEEPEEAQAEPADEAPAAEEALSSEGSSDAPYGATASSSSSEDSPDKPRPSGT